MNPKLTGAYGEHISARFLRQKGFDIVTTNFRINSGEIDIVAQLDGVIHFVEVKTRKTGGIYTPAEAVDFHKKENIRTTAGVYMNRFKLKNHFQFDIIEVLIDEFDNEKVVSVNFIEKAF